MDVNRLIKVVGGLDWVSIDKILASFLHQKTHYSFVSRTVSGLKRKQTDGCKIAIAHCDRFVPAIYPCNYILHIECETRLIGSAV